MVRKYKRLSSRKSWPVARMEAAVRSVKEKGTPVKRAAEEHGVPRKTLAKYLKLEDATPLTRLELSLGCFKTVFTARQEEELVSHILELEKRCYGIGTRDVRSLAFELAERNNINHPFNRDVALAGWDWFYGFRSRHKNLSLRIAEPTSAARLQGFNPVAIDRFFDILEDLPQKFPPSRVYNVDETSVCTVRINSHLGIEFSPNLCFL